MEGEQRTTQCTVRLTTAQLWRCSSAAKVWNQKTSTCSASCGSAWLISWSNSSSAAARPLNSSKPTTRRAVGSNVTCAAIFIPSNVQHPDRSYSKSWRVSASCSAQQRTADQQVVVVVAVVVGGGDSGVAVAVAVTVVAAVAMAVAVAVAVAAVYRWCSGGCWWVLGAAGGGAMATHPLLQLEHLVVDPRRRVEILPRPNGGGARQVEHLAQLEPSSCVDALEGA